MPISYWLLLIRESTLLMNFTLYNQPLKPNAGCVVSRHQLFQCEEYSYAAC